MSVRRVRCPCLGKLECKLCQGTKVYDYEVGPRGWMPFRCPTCEGTRTLPVEGELTQPCYTCRGAGMVDPAQPVSDGTGGFLRKLWKIFFGG